MLLEYKMTEIVCELPENYCHLSLVEYFSALKSNHHNLYPSALGPKIHIPISVQFHLGSKWQQLLLAVTSPCISVVIPFIAWASEDRQEISRWLPFISIFTNEITFSWLFLVSFLSSQMQEVLPRKHLTPVSHYWSFLDKLLWLHKLTISDNK